MRRILAPLLVAAALLSGAAPALADSKPSLAGLKCEDKDAKAYISDSIRSMKFDNGQALSAIASRISVTNAETISASARKLICKIRVDITISGQSTVIRGRYTIELFPNGTATSSFDPFY